MFQHVTRRSVSDEVFDQLCTRIVQRDLKAGEELPSERLLSEMLGVSRNAVREAIKRLQQACLVEVKHGGTTLVQDYQTQAGADLLPHLLFDAKGHLQVDVARSIVRMRQVLSPEIARDAARRSDAAVVERLQGLVCDMEQADSNVDLQGLAFAFWEALVDGSGNIAYRLAFNSLRRTYEPLWSLLTPMLGRELQKIDSFKGLLESIRTGQCNDAMHCAQSYIDASSAAIYRFLDMYEQQTGATGQAPLLNVPPQETGQ